MDPKGDRLRKIQMGTLKLPDSVLKSTLTSETPKARGLEGGGPPRAATVFNSNVQGTSPKGNPIILASNRKGAKLHSALPPNVDIPLPSDADIPLPSDRDIPLPATPAPADIPLPRDEDIPLPSDASIPLPADKPPQERRKIKVSLSHLEPKGDELLCRSCVMRFTKQHDYDLHLQSDGHQQVF